MTPPLDQPETANIYMINYSNTNNQTVNATIPNTVIATQNAQATIVVSTQQIVMIV